jgi:cell division protein FtsI/penicillin-binding protein 2
VLDLKTGSTVAVVGEARNATPGSTLKPLLLEYALRHGIVTPETKVFCHRNLRVGDRSLPCTHPANEDVFTAETALAEFCNTYFADIARRFSSPDLETTLREARIPHRPLDRATMEERELATLGLKDVMVTPVELARAYRGLAKSLETDGPVERGKAQPQHEEQTGKQREAELQEHEANSQEGERSSEYGCHFGPSVADGSGTCSCSAPLVA